MAGKLCGREHVPVPPPQRCALLGAAGRSIAQKTAWLGIIFRFRGEKGSFVREGEIVPAVFVREGEIVSSFERLCRFMGPCIDGGGGAPPRLVARTCLATIFPVRTTAAAAAHRHGVPLRFCGLSGESAGAAATLPARAAAAARRTVHATRAAAHRITHTQRAARRTASRTGQPGARPGRSPVCRAARA